MIIEWPNDTINGKTNLGVAMIDFEIIPGEQSIYEIWKYVDGKQIGMMGMISDLDKAREIVTELYRICGNPVDKYPNI